MRDGHLEASGHNWVEGQGAGARIDKNDGEEEVTYDAMGNKIENKKQKKLTSAEARKVRRCSYSLLGLMLTNFLSPCSSRRSGWHGKREARRSPTMSCKATTVVFFSLMSSLCYLCPCFPYVCPCPLSLLPCIVHYGIMFEYVRNDIFMLLSFCHLCARKPGRRLSQ